MNWVIKSVYNTGGHTVMRNGEPMRFRDKQDAINHAEVLTSEMKKVGISGTSYIVVEDTL